MPLKPETRAMIRCCVLCCASAALLVFCSSTKPEYGLPIALGTTSDEVRKVLGKPNDRLGQPQIGENGGVTMPATGDEITEFYYAKGIVAFFERDRLAAITLHTSPNWAGFVPYVGKVVNGVTLADSKQTILNKLGTPAKVENGDLAEGTDRDVPVVWPAESNYYWRFKDYGVQATFLNQAQSVDQEKHLVFPKDKLVSIIVENTSLADKDISQPSKAATNYFFVWKRQMQLPPIHLPITQSATCRFKKSVGVGFQKPDPNSRLPEGISYSAHDEDESDTVTFINLDTHSPTVRSNGGQAQLQVTYNDNDLISLVHTNRDGAAEMYTIFRTEGVVVHTTHEHSELVGPFGVIEMGYCN